MLQQRCGGVRTNIPHRSQHRGRTRHGAHSSAGAAAFRVRNMNETTRPPAALRTRPRAGRGSGSGAGSAAAVMPAAVPLAIYPNGIRLRRLPVSTRSSLRRCSTSDFPTATPTAIRACAAVFGPDGRVRRWVSTTVRRCDRAPAFARDDLSDDPSDSGGEGRRGGRCVRFQRRAWGRGFRQARYFSLKKLSRHGWRGISNGELCFTAQRRRILLEISRVACGVSGFVAAAD